MPKPEKDETACWIFQANPEHYDVKLALKNLKEITWVINQHTKEIQAGDHVYVWQSGSDGGIVAEAKVLLDPTEMEESPAELKFYTDPTVKPELALRTILAIEQTFDPPVVNRDFLKAHEQLKELLIIRRPTGTNFSVDLDHAKELDRIIENRSTRDYHVYRTWNVLVECAANKRTITYSELGEKVGVYHRNFGRILDVIYRYCLKKYPTLTILVVEKETGRPSISSGIAGCREEEFDIEQERVFDFDWSRIDNPCEFASDGTSEDELIDKILDHPSSADDVLVKVKARGPAQNLFRKALLKVYKSTCAFCGLTFADALEAAHIVPWSSATNRQRLDVRNGLLLCSTHHRLFDSHVLSVTTEFKIQYNGSGKESKKCNANDAICSLHNRKLRLPDKLKYQPSGELIRERNIALIKK